jgi:long-subunit acyl-CoA synthetase (AMP-forming)
MIATVEMEKAVRGVEPLPIETALCEYSRLIERAVIHRAGDGSLVADVFLNHTLLRGRAEQQGLGDGSVAAALEDPGIARVLTEALAAINAGQPGEPVAAARIRG